MEGTYEEKSGKQINCLGTGIIYDSNHDAGYGGLGRRDRQWGG